MSADTIAADNAPVVIPDLPAYQFNGQAIPYTAVDFAVEGSTSDRVAIAYQDTRGENGQDVVVAEYDLQGGQIYADHLSDSLNNVYGTSDIAIATVPGKGVGVTYLDDMYGGLGVYPNAAQTLEINAGEEGPRQQLAGLGDTTRVQIFSTPGGYHLEWTSAQPNPSGPPSQIASYQQDFSGGQPVAPATSESGVASTPPYANIQIGGLDFVIQDNQAQLAAQAAVTLPGEPAHAITDLAAAALADGHSAAVAWVDSGTDYLSIYDSTSNSFGPTIGLDWGGASDLHIVALPDGGFAVSWQNGGDKGELFDSAGHGGGVMNLTGQFAAIDSAGELYTVGVSPNGQATIQTYAINGAGASSGGTSSGGGGGTTSGGGGSTSGSGSEVYTSDPTYTAPDGVATIHLTGSNQTVTANNAGDVIWSDNTVNHLIGGTGDDVFHLGRGGDIATGGGGADTFAYAEVPWNGGQITDFGAGDVIDLTGLLHQAGYSGDDPVGAHYLDIAPTVSGAELQVSAFGQFWEIAIVDGVSAADLQVNGDLVTPSANGAGGPVTTSASNYVAPANVTSITLTGSQQHVDASAVTTGVTINSNDTGNTLIGGSGNDVFHLGRGGDVVTGGAGADDFMYAQTPWAGGVITDFNASEGDRIDVSGLLHRSGYLGSDPFGAGYLKYTTDGAGNAQLWSDIPALGPDTWWLVATLDGVSTSSLHYANGLIT